MSIVPLLSLFLLGVLAGKSIQSKIDRKIIENLQACIDTEKLMSSVSNRVDALERMLRDDNENSDTLYISKGE